MVAWLAMTRIAGQHPMAGRASGRTSRPTALAQTKRVHLIYALNLPFIKATGYP
jgi:hypothetical protein